MRNLFSIAVPMCPCSQKTRRGPNPPEESKFLVLIDVSVSAAFNELVVEPFTISAQ